MIDSSPEASALISGRVEKSEPAALSALADEAVRLFDEMRVPLLRYLSGFPLAPQDAEDVIQEAFLALFQQSHRGGSVRNVRGWLFRAVHNLALKKRIGSRRDLESADALPVAGALIDPALSPEDRLAFNRTQERLQAVVRALPEQHRWCLYLRAEGVRYREIAQILNISLGSVCGCLQRSLTLIARAAER